MSILQEVKNAVLSVIESYFTSDMDVMSKETRRIFSNPEDRKKYIKAVEKLQNGDSKKETVHLSTGKIVLS